MKLNCTLDERPATASLRSATPKENTPCFFVLREGGFSSNGKGVFFRGSALNESGRWRGYNADSVLRKLFFGEEKDFAKPRLNFARAQEGFGEECARAGRRLAIQKGLKKL